MRGHPKPLSRVRSSLVGAAAVAAVALLALAVTTLGPAGGAAAAPGVLAAGGTPSPSAGADSGGGNPNLGPATPGKVVCTVNSSALTQVTGMVASGSNIYVIQGGDVADPSSVAIYTVNAKTCAFTSRGYYNGVDPQDLALGADGALWAADIGDGITDTDNTRGWVTFEQLTIGQTGGTSFRALYPTSGKLDFQAMILDKDDAPIIFAASGGTAGIYKTNKAMAADKPATSVLTKVGDFTPVATGTENPKGAIGAALVTGAAKSPDGTRVVIRTMSDAYEYTVGDDGDIVKAITSTQPIITPLPNEPDGHAITYSADGKSFLTLSKGAKPKLLSYTPFVPAPATDPPGAGTGGDGGGADTQASGPSFLSKLTFSQLTRIVAAIGAVGLVLAIAGIVGIRRARKRRREEEEYDDYDDYDEAPRGRRGRGRDRDDDYGRDAHYGEGYDEYGQNGYAEAGYGATGYADNGYGANGYAGAGAAGGYAAGHEQNGYGANGYDYGAAGYAEPAYDPTAAGYGQPSYGGGQQTYGAQQQYGGEYDQYGQPAYDGGQYAGDQYGGQYGGYDQYGGRQPGYDDFDPMHDPRRR